MPAPALAEKPYETRLFDEREEFTELDVRRIIKELETERLEPSRPADYLAHLNALLGRAYDRGARPQDALEAKLRAATLQPGSAIYQHNLGNAYLQLERFDLALDAFARAARMQGDWDADALLHIAQALAGHGQWADAHDAFREAMQRFSSRLALDLYRAAEIAALLDLEAEAVELFARAEATENEQPLGEHDALEWLARHRARWNRAALRKAYPQAVRAVEVALASRQERTRLQQNPPSVQPPLAEEERETLNVFEAMAPARQRATSAVLGENPDG